MKTCDYKTFKILDVLGLWHAGVTEGFFLNEFKAQRELGA